MYNGEYILKTVIPEGNELITIELPEDVLNFLIDQGFELIKGFTNAADLMTLLSISVETVLRKQLNECKASKETKKDS